ncbi:MAG TPA: hypothetical protein VJT09_19910 [Pyrinomonadaceae bacterium]|nr:hypothetical protein [Pyrinomonadaceae bacterium]
MLTFLHSFFFRRAAVLKAGVPPKARQFLAQRRTLYGALLLFALASAAAISERRASARSGPPPGADDSPSAGAKRKRITALRRVESPDGSRITFTSDAPLDDYKFYVEGERLFVLIPRCALITARGDASGRGFTDLRVEQRDDEVLLSFRLQQGSTVAVSQSFNRLAVVFMTNERAN